MSFLLGPLFVGVLAVAAPLDDRLRFEAVAEKLKFFPVYDVAYDRPGDRFIPKAWAADWKVARDLITSPDHTVPELLGLLRHKDPRVRTLALAALFHREDPKLLPHIFKLTQDGEKTFPRLEPIARTMSFDPEKQPPLTGVQTVRQVARAFVEFYLERIGNPRDFTAYWAARKDRTFCASWFGVRLERALQGTSNFDKTRLDRIRALRKDIDRLAPVDRDWTLLWLCGHSDASFNPEAVGFLATADELVQAGKRLGPERLVALLQGKEISSDPDLGTDDSSRPGRRLMISFVLKHAGKLLRPEDKPVVLALEQTFPTPWCSIAAAELDPANAKQLLQDALTRFTRKGHSAAWHRAELAAARWRLLGEKDIGDLVNWFYSEKVDLNPSTTQTDSFLQGIAGVRAPADRKLLAALIADQRFDKLDYQSLRAVALTIQRWTKQPVIPQEELYNTRYWRGQNVEGLAEWRRKLKASVPEWNK